MTSLWRHKNCLIIFWFLRKLAIFGRIFRPEGSEIAQIWGHLLRLQIFRNFRISPENRDYSTGSLSKSPICEATSNFKIFKKYPNLQMRAFSSGNSYKYVRLRYDRSYIVLCTGLCEILKSRHYHVTMTSHI